MTKPLWVYVEWSESTVLTKKSLLSFFDFEMACKKAVIELGVDNGYYKTMVQVLFDDGISHKARMNLSPQEDNDFQSYCENMIKWVVSERQLSGVYDEYYENLREYFLIIEWP